MATTTMSVTTRDGPMRTVKVTPQTGTGPWPALVFCIDGIGLRETLVQMAQHFADDAGVVVFVPDLFFRCGDVHDLAPPGTPKTPAALWSLMASADFRAQWRPKFFEAAIRTDNVRAAFDGVFAALDDDADVEGRGVGVTGYCMGGHIALKAAGLYPDRVKAAASFHGGFLASDAPESPHTLAKHMKAKIYVAGASDDGSFPEPMKQKLVAALGKAGVDFVVETWPARHGWCVPDHPSFNAAEAERARMKLVSLLQSTLKR